MPTKHGPDRIPCVVIGCGRTASKEWAGGDTEIICGKHWRLAPVYMRRRYRRIRRLVDKAETAGDARAHFRASNLAWAYWDSMKRRIIEIAMGITAR